MFEDYMNNFNNIITSFFYITFISILVLLVISLLLLILGCLIKSQTLKSKFLKTVPFLMIGIFFILLIPILYIRFKGMI